jgi:hypothetical protein
MSFIQLVLHVYFSWNFSLHTSIIDLKKKIDDFTESCPLLELMANKAMKERHWDRMATLTGHTFDLDSENFMLRDIMKAPLLQYKPVQASTLTYFSTCPFRQLTKKSTCPIQSFSCPKKFIKITKTMVHYFWYLRL